MFEPFLQVFCIVRSSWFVSTNFFYNKFYERYLLVDRPAVLTWKRQIPVVMS